MSNISHMSKKLLLAALLAASLPAAVLADDGPGAGKAAHEQHGGHERHDHKDRHAAGMHGDKALDLSREQKKQIHSLRSEAMQNRQHIIDKYLAKLPAAEQQAMQKELAANRKQSEQAIRSKLNAEQQKKFDQMQAQKTGHRSEAGKAKAQPEAVKVQ